MKKVCIFIEQRNGTLTSNSQKILFMAQTLKEEYGYKLFILFFDANKDACLSSIKGYEAEAVYYIRLRMEGQCFFNREEVNNLASFIRKMDPDIVWACSNVCYKILLPKLAYILNTGLCAACLDFIYNNTQERIEMIRTAYSNNAYARIAVHRSKPLMATIIDDSKPYALKRGSGFPAFYEVTTEIIVPGAVNLSLRTVQAVESVCLTTSKIVIGLGNGIRDKSDIYLFRQLSALLHNAAIGGTRELVNRQIIPHSRQIGATGTQIYADLYIAFGISGSPQHMQGIEGVKKIVSVNHDPYAPIFQYSDYGVVGDLFEVAQYIIHYLMESAHVGQ